MGVHDERRAAIAAHAPLATRRLQARDGFAVRAVEDLGDDGGLGIGVVLHMPPGLLGEVAFGALVAVPRGVVVAQPVPENAASALPRPRLS
jgi:hypothetical protein